MLPFAALLAFAPGGPAAFQYSVSPDHGLQIEVGGVPVVQGSWVQYYEPDWSKAYFNSTNSTETVKNLDNGDVVLMFKSLDGKAYGSELFSSLPDGVKVTYSLGWTGDKPIAVELTAGALWSAPLQHGSLEVDGKQARSLAASAYPANDLDSRTYAKKGKLFAFQAPLGTLTFQGDESNWTCFDARNMNKGWARGKDLIWLGQPNVLLQPSNVVSAVAEWHFTPPSDPDPLRGGTLALISASLANAVLPDTNTFQVIPTPRSMLVKPDQPFFVGKVVDVDPPDSMPLVGQAIVSALQTRWNVPDLESRYAATGRFIVRIQDTKLPPGGYELRITPDDVVIEGQDAEGVRNAISTLGQLAFAKDGRLCLPGGIVRDWPSVLWRGVHLFVGPEALSFHEKLWNRVLLPLKFNKVIVQCERTKWRSLPSPKPADYMSRQDLLSLFDFYRGIGVEPIPLIESLGHMNWLFNDSATTKFALFPDPAMSLDPRIPAADKLLAAVWNEAIHLLQPREIHFGLDEVNIRWPQKDPELEDQIWMRQLPFLAQIAASHGCRMMCWGDQCLATGDAPDAALADDEQAANLRRAYIPKGSIVCDWHYIDDPNPDRFMHTLDLWKQDGVTPIAAAWFRPENIRGFYLAAIKEGIGTLQTTWAGYQSNEAGMIREFRQFAAMVVAADYAWSGRTDAFDKLGYDPYQVFSHMYFDGPSSLSPLPGMCAELADGIDSRVGPVEFKIFDPYSLRSSLSSQAMELPEDLVVQTPGLKGSTLCLAVDTSTAIEMNQPVADVEIHLSSGQVVRKSLAYGVDVRAANDPKANVVGPRNSGLSLVRISLGPNAEVERIVLHATSTYAGLRLHGVTAY